MITTLKMARKPVKLQEEDPTRCAGEGKHAERRKLGEEKRAV